MRKGPVSLFAGLLLLAAAGCNPGNDSRPMPAQVAAGSKNAVTEIDSPASGGAEPFLFAARDGSLIMSWMEQTPSSKNAALKFARLSAERWSRPVTIVERDDLFVNWADFPSVVEAIDGTLFAHWLQRSSSGKYSYDVMLARSGDGGNHWSTPAKLHDDRTASEHGFVSLVPVPSTPAVAAVWLDGRNMHEGSEHGDHGEMTLRYTVVRNDGTAEPSVELDHRTCECCTTAMAWSEQGPIVAYRDRSSTGIRDIAIARKTPEGWATQILHADGWKIEGCPVNGPQIDARGHHVAVAWFTGAGDKPQVQVAFSSDAGATFSAPVRIDSGAATGRVDVALLDDGGAFVTWIEGLGNDAAIVGRRISLDAKMDPVLTLARSSTARRAGFPRLARIGNRLYVAWTDVAAKRIRVMRVML